MPYYDHRKFDTPDWDSTIWRYISIPQLMSILHKEALFFTRADKFSDPFEGTYPVQNIQSMNTGEPQIPQKGVLEPQRKYDTENPELHVNFSNDSSRIEFFKRISFINSWHRGDTETAGMWRSNLEANSGVVIKSSTDSLRDSFHVFKDNDVFIGNVDYIDFSSERIPENNLMVPYKYKRIEFEHEKELRAVITSYPHEDYPGLKDQYSRKTIFFNWENQPSGKYIPVDVEELIDEVHVSPNAPPWHCTVLENMVKEYEYNIDILESELDVSPHHLIN